MTEEKTVIYRRGKPGVEKKIDPMMLQIIALDDIQVGLMEVNQHLKKAEFKGVADPRTIPITDELQEINLVRNWPFTPWITAFFINDGPDIARIGINQPHRDKFFELGVDETRTIDHAHADERIHHIYCVCDAGDTASVRMEGQI